MKQPLFTLVVLLRSKGISFFLFLFIISFVVVTQAQEPPPIVEPLEQWVPIEKPQIDSSQKDSQNILEKNENLKKKSLYDRLLLEGEKEIDSEEDVQEAAPAQTRTPYIKKVNLNRQQRARIAKAKRQILGRVRKYWKQYIAENHRDRRGPAELRVCSLNINGYGIKDKLKRKSKNKNKSKLSFSMKEDSIIKGIADTQCDVIALQGLYSVKLENCRLALKRLIHKLKKLKNVNWDYYAEPKEEMSFHNVFLFDKNVVQVIGAHTHYDKLLPYFGEFQTKKFLRYPSQITFMVEGKDGAPAKTITLLNMDLSTENASTLVGKPLLAKMQMAEALRQIVSFDQQEINPEDPPIYILLGERSSPISGLESQLISGHLKLIDFEEKGKCKLSEEQLAICENKSTYPTLLFGLMTNSLPPEGKIISKDIIDPESKTKKKEYYKVVNQAQMKKFFRQKRERTNDMYLFQDDLPFAWEREYSPGRYKIGTQKVNTGLKNSPLIYVELNW